MDIRELPIEEWPMQLREILRAGSAGPGEVLTALVALELRGLVREEFGAWHRV